MNELYNLFIKPYESYETYQIVLESLAALFGVLSVYFSIKKNIWVYPTGIISTIIYVYILFVFGLLWSKNSVDEVHVDVTYTKRKDWFFAVLLFVFSIGLVTLIYYYKPYIDNHFAATNDALGLYHLDWANWMDIFVTSLFLVGMWLMAKRRIENWIFWIFGDFISIPMYIYKGLGITSAQYLVFTIMAIIGLIEWRKSYNQRKKLKK